MIHWEPSGNGVTLITIQLYGASLQDRVTDRKPNHIPTDELKQGDHKQVRKRKHHKTPLFGKLKHCETLLMAEKWQQGKRNKPKKKKTIVAHKLLNRESSICAKMSCSPWGRSKTAQWQVLQAVVIAGDYQTVGKYSPWIAVQVRSFLSSKHLGKHWQWIFWKIALQQCYYLLLSHIV